MNDLKDNLICDKCNKPVDKITRYNDVINNQIIYTAYCHGELEKTNLDINTLLNCSKITLKSIKFEKAFKQKTGS